jgi:hypothetical protein
MDEQQVRKKIRNILIESLEEVHLTLHGKYVPFDSDDCYQDLLNRIADAESQRNCCDRGTAARMHYNGLLAILRQKSKKHPLHFKKVNDNSLKEANLYSTFIQPFTDILSAGKFVFQTALSSLWLNFRVFLAIKPSTIDKLINDHEGRMKKFEKQFEPVLKRSNMALSGPDAQVAFFFLAPNVWASKFAVDWSKDKVKSFVDFVKQDTNPKPSNVPEKPNTSSPGAQTLAANVSKEIDKKFEQFKKLFVESKQNKSLLIEKDEAKEEISSEMESAINDFINSDMRKEAAKALQQSIELTVKPFNDSIDAVKKMMQIVIESDSIEKMFKDLKDIKFEQDQEFVFEIEKLRNEILKTIANSQKEINNLSNPANQMGSKFNQALKGILVANSSKEKKDVESMEVDPQKLKDMKLDQSKVKENSQKLILNSLKSEAGSKGQEAIEQTQKEIGQVLIKAFPFIQDDELAQVLSQENADFSNLLKKIKSDYKI